jgi:Na+-transporting NADH:ubiquinone oxidoreductase subunit A
MKLRGGYNIRLAGRPAGGICTPDQPEVLLLPQRSRRLRFNKLLVKSGQSVRCGQVLAVATGQFDLPLLAPMDGVVRLRVHRGHVLLDSLSRGEPLASAAVDSPFGAERQALIDRGVWPYFHDAHGDGVPDPARPVSAAIVATTQLEPFAGPRGDVLLGESLDAFLRGLDCLVSLVDGVTYVAVPLSRSPLAVQLRQSLAGKPRIQVIDIPLRYPLDHFDVLARALGFKSGREQTVWGLQTEGVLAIDQALNGQRPLLDRVVAVGGSAVSDPVHLRVPLGYPIPSLLAGRVTESPHRVVDGGILNGQAVDEHQLGIGVESSGLTVLLEPTRRELWGFVRTGLDRISYSNCFMSLFRPRYAERLTTALRGEHRPCIGCGFCEELCPAGIMPHWIHKLAYQDALEEIDRCASHRCVACGLCSYVCPSKLDLRREILEVNDVIRRDLHAADVRETEEVEG